MMAVDILPTALPREASEHFCAALVPYLRTVVRQYLTPVAKEGREEEKEEKELELERAVVASGGALREEHQWLEEPLGLWRDHQCGLSQSHWAAAAQVGAQSDSRGAAAAAAADDESGDMAGGVRKKRVLMLGSGMVAGPAVDEITRHGDVELLIGEWLPQTLLGSFCLPEKREFSFSHHSEQLVGGSRAADGPREREERFGALCRHKRQGDGGEVGRARGCCCQVCCYSLWMAGVLNC